MSDTTALQLQFKYSELVQLWQDFCQWHTNLYDLTCSEYQALLESRIEDLEDLIRQKEELIGGIRNLEEQRAQVVSDIGELVGRDLEKVSEIYPIAAQYQLDPNNTVERYNLLLLDIITKIQDQNKRNQIFLNKAIISLQGLKEQFKGKKNFKTYNNRGNTLSP